jgi:hypothetical protein
MALRDAFTSAATAAVTAAVVLAVLVGTALSVGTMHADTGITIGSGANSVTTDIAGSAANTYHQTIERWAPAPVGGAPGQQRVQRTIQVTPAADDGSVQAVEAIIDGSILCNGVDRSAWVLEGHAVATRAAGSTGRLANIAVLSNAYTGGDSFIDAYSFYSDNGTLRNIGPATLGASTIAGITDTGALTMSGNGAVTLGNNVAAFQVPAGPVTIGQASTVSDGTQLQTKNTNAGNSIGGMDVGLDTTVNAGARGGYFVYRGAGGGFGGSSEVGMVLAGGTNDFIVGASAGDMGVFNTTVGKSILFSADGSTFKAQMALDSTGNLKMLNVGHLRAQGNAVTLTNATCNSTSCNDIAGTVTTSSTTMTITFASTYTGADDATCVIEPRGAATLPTCTTSATAITCTTVATATKYHYLCIGH